MTTIALPEAHKQNFDTLARAFDACDAALLECQLAATGETVAVICAVNRLSDGTIEFAPFATLFNDSPFLTVNPPNPEGGFHSQETP